MTRLFNTHALRATAIAAIFFTSASAAQAEMVTEQMFLDTHVGNCVSYSGPSTGTQCYNADGTTTYTDESYGEDSGTWEYSDGQICVKWSREAGTSCNAYKQEADGSFSATTGYVWSVDG